MIFTLELDGHADSFRLQKDGTWRDISQASGLEETDFVTPHPGKMKMVAFFWHNGRRVILSKARISRSGRGVCPGRILVLEERTSLVSIAGSIVRNSWPAWVAHSWNDRYG